MLSIKVVPLFIQTFNERNWSCHLSDDEQIDLPPNWFTTDDIAYMYS